jgi:RNA polymerase sigma factor (sigma-70 family)
VHPEFDEAGAISAARDGDREAFARLVDEYQEVAFRAAYLVTRDAAEAEDVIQDAFLRAHRALGSFRVGDPVRPWVLRIVTNAALNAVRSRTRQRGLLARFGRLRQPEVAQPEALMLESEGQRLLWRALNELSEDDRTVLYLRWFLELPEQEIAVVIGKAPGTVKSRLHRAGGRLRAVIEERYPALRPGGEHHA